MYTVAAELSPTKSVVVPVTCDACSNDMTFTVEHIDDDHRRWWFSCGSCERVDDAGTQRRYQLWANDNTIYVGSYWGPDDD